MKTNKKIYQLITSSIILASMFVGCSNGTTTTQNTETKTENTNINTETNAETNQKTSITLVLSSRDEWLSTLATAAIDTGAELGYEVVVQDCQNDNSKLIQYVETAKNAGSEVMVVNLVDYSLAGEVIEAAGDMGIVFVNRCPDESELLDATHVYVGSDEAEAGLYQGEYLAEYFNAIGKTDIKYLLLSGNLGMTSTTMRTNFAIEGMENGGLTVTEATAPLVCEWNRATTIDNIGPIIAQNLEYDCIIANNDAMALGAVEALQAARKDPSETPIVGIDATQDGCISVENGEMAMTVFQNAEGQGSASILAAINILNDKPFNDNVDFSLDENNEFSMYVPFEPVTIDNVADYM